MNEMQTTTQIKESIGCIIDCSANSSDDLSLEILAYASSLGYEYEALDEEDEDYSQDLYEESEAAVDWLNEQDLCEPFCYFTVEDNSLFVLPAIDQAREDDSVVVCEDLPSYVLQINDHGNATLYAVQLTEIWGVV